MNSETRYFGCTPWCAGQFDLQLPEFMHYLYLPVCIDDLGLVALPENVEVCRPLIDAAIDNYRDHYIGGLGINYVYLTARRGFATPDNPLNRPGWHTDGFGTLDLNYVWWDGPGTRFITTGSDEINPPKDHRNAMDYFDNIAREYVPVEYDQGFLYGLDQYVVHATPVIKEPCERQFIKISLSPYKYNLEGNSHNYKLDYHWPMHRRSVMRNDPHRAMRDSY